MTRNLGWTLVQFLWQGTIFAVVFALLRWWKGERWTARARYRWACGTLCAMAAAPVITFFVQSGAVAPTSAWPLVSTSAWEPILPKLTLVWLAGVAFFSLRLARNWQLTARLRKNGVEMAPEEWRQRFEKLAARMGAPARVHLLISTRMTVPATTGWVRPVVFLPATMLTGLPTAQIEALIAHELAHVVRFDYLVNVLQSVAEAVLFYHPAVWWISGQIRAEREFLCDDLAAAACGDRIEYAQALAAMETERQAQLALAANDGPLLVRIRRLVAPQEPAPTPAASTALAMSVLWAAGFSAVLAQAEPQQPATSPAAPVEVAQTRQIPAPPVVFSPFGPAPQAPATPAPVGEKKLSVTGRVTSSTGEPLGLSEVTLLPAGGGEPYTIRSSADGRFQIEDVKAGNYTLNARKAGYLSPAQPLSVAVTGETSASEHRVQLTAQAVIAGEVVDRYGEPLSPGEVGLFRVTYTQQGEKRAERVSVVSLDDQGRFRIPSLPAGRYYVMAAGPRPAPGQTRDVPMPTYFPNSLDLEGASAIELAAGATQAVSIRVRHETLRTIRGRLELTGATGAVQPGVTLRSTGPSGISPSPTPTPKVAADGSFEVMVAPGRYIVEGRACVASATTPPLCYDGYTGASRFASTPVEIAVRAGDVNGVILPVKARLTVNGVVTAEGGDLKKLPAFSALSIGLAKEDSKEFFPGTPGPDGTFHVTVSAPGRYHAVLQSMPDTLWAKSVRVDGQDALLGPVDVSSESKMEVVLAENPASVSGILRNAQGVPIANAVVAIWPDRMQVNLTAPVGRVAGTDANGAFRFGGLGPGEYRVAAWEGETRESGVLRMRPFLAQFSIDVERVRAATGTTVTASPKIVSKEAIAAAMAKLP